MTSPHRGLCAESLETARAYGVGADDATGFALLSSLAREPRLPLSIRVGYMAARDAMRTIASIVATAVESRDAVALGLVEETAPEAANETTRPVKNCCAVCGWPLVDDPERGCVRGNCSMRPMPERFYDKPRADAEKDAWLEELRSARLRADTLPPPTDRSAELDGEGRLK